MLLRMGQYPLGLMGETLLNIYRQPLSMEELKSDLIRGVTRELEDLKATLKTEIQRLVTQRDQLVEEVNMFAHTREQTIQDTEQLNLKNAQLADLNNELTRRIQGQFKANKAPVNGLGIFTGNPMDILESMKGSSEEKRPPTANTSSASMSMSSISIPIPVQDYQQQPLQHQPTQQLQSSQSHLHANDGAEVLVAQKVTTLKNGAQPKKTFWKKGSASIMKGAGKGFNKVCTPKKYAVLLIGQIVLTLLICGRLHLSPLQTHLVPRFSVHERAGQRTTRVVQTL